MEPKQWLTLILFGLTIFAVITNILDNTLSTLVDVALMGQAKGKYTFWVISVGLRRLRLGMPRAFLCICGSMRVHSEREDL